MLAMQYSVRLPKEFTIEQVNQHVSKRSQLFKDCPGLKHKFYLYDPEENIYAPFYIWENSQYAQNFLLNKLFSGVVERFGRPRVRSWQILDMDFGTYKKDPGYMRCSVDKVPSNKPLAQVINHEKAIHRDTLAKEGLYAHLVLLDADRWEIARFGFWENEDRVEEATADCVVGYDVLKMNQHLQGAA